MMKLANRISAIRRKMAGTGGGLPPNVAPPPGKVPGQPTDGLGSSDTMMKRRRPRGVTP